jgi:hypothetical protein
MYVESVVCPATQIDAFLRGSRSLGFGALALRANTIREPVVFLCERASERSRNESTRRRKQARFW